MLYKKLLALEGIERWNHHPHIRHQSVAAHSFNVTIITYMLCGILGEEIFTYQEAMRQALWHDFSESVTGDVSPLVKRYAQWDEVDRRAVQEAGQISTSHRYDVILPKDKELIPIVKLADCLDAWMYARNECNLGNTMGFEDIRDELAGKVGQLINTIGATMKGGPIKLHQAITSLFAHDFCCGRTKKIGLEMSHV